MKTDSDAGATPPSPRVSVVTTVWNGHKYIGEMIESLLSQTFRDFESIIVDDGSTDSTCAVVESFRDPRIRLVRRPHEGVYLAANFAVSLARGEYVARLDADDISLPDRLARQVARLDANPSAVMCYTEIAAFGENIFGEFSPNHRQAHFIRDSRLGSIQMCFRSPFVHSSTMYRRWAFDAVGGYPDTHPCEDTALFTKMLRLGPFIGIPTVLVRFRRHAESATVRRRPEVDRRMREICVDHILHFLKVDEAEAEKIYTMLLSIGDIQDWRGWFAFCALVLKRRPECRAPEPLGWLISRTVGTAVRQLRSGR